MNTKAIVAAVVVIVLLGVGLYAYNHNKSKESGEYSSQNQSSGAASSANPAPSTSTSSVSNTAKVTTPAPSDAYTKAINLYGPKGYRIQFSQCRGNPGHLSIKKGVQFMLDNRDNVAHTIVMKSQTFHIPAYGFSIVAAKDLGTYNITCDGGGAMQLNVEG